MCGRGARTRFSREQRYRSRGHRGARRRHMVSTAIFRKYSRAPASGQACLAPLLISVKRCAKTPHRGVFAFLHSIRHAPLSVKTRIPRYPGYIDRGAGTRFSRELRARSSAAPECRQHSIHYRSPSSPPASCCQKTKVDTEWCPLSFGTLLQNRSLVFGQQIDLSLGDDEG